MHCWLQRAARNEKRGPASSKPTRSDLVKSVTKLTSISTVLILFCAVFTGPCAHAVISPSSLQVCYVGVKQVACAPGEVIIGLGEESRETLQNLLDSWNAKIVDELPEIHAYLVRLEEPDVTARMYEAKALAHARLYVDPNYYVHAALMPNDPLWPSQWGLAKVRADLAWDIELGKKGVIVAVIDTGMDYHHEDLAENYLPSGYDWVNHHSNPMDDNGHGTHVAGIIDAVTNNGVCVAGLAQVSVMAEKVLDSTGSGTIFDAAEGVIDAANKGARITNNSYGTYLYSDTLRAAFEYASSRGVLNVAAAGNDSSDRPFYPAAWEENSRARPVTVPQVWD
jgi:thermitase